MIDLEFIWKDHRNLLTTQIGIKKSRVSPSFWQKPGETQWCHHSEHPGATGWESGWDTLPSVCSPLFPGWLNLPGFLLLTLKDKIADSHIPYPIQYQQVSWVCVTPACRETTHLALGQFDPSPWHIVDVWKEPGWVLYLVLSVSFVIKRDRQAVLFVCSVPKDISVKIPCKNIQSIFAKAQKGK